MGISRKTKEWKVLDLKWIYTMKAENVYKARIIVREYQQTDVLDDIYLPVAKTQTLEILLPYCCESVWESERLVWVSR